MSPGRWHWPRAGPSSARGSYLIQHSSRYFVAYVPSGSRGFMLRGEGERKGGRCRRRMVLPNQVSVSGWGGLAASLVCTGGGLAASLVCAGGAGSIFGVRCGSRQPGAGRLRGPAQPRCWQRCRRSPRAPAAPARLRSALRRCGGLLPRLSFLVGGKETQLLARFVILRM